jgi:hypothetical protein
MADTMLVYDCLLLMLIMKRDESLFTHNGLDEHQIRLVTQAH